MNNEKKRSTYTFLWFIENYSYCWHKNDEPLRSPVFSFDGLEGTRWFLGIFPKGSRAENKGNISLFLCRSASDTGSERFSFNFELSVLGLDGSALDSEKYQDGFEKGAGIGSLQLVLLDDVHLRRKADYLPNDILSIRCVMWKNEGDILKTEQIVARTRIITEYISFFHVVENFSKLQENEKHETKTRSPLFKEFEITSRLYFVKGSGSEEKIIIEIVPSDASKILHECKLYLQSDYRLVECGGVDNDFNAEENREQNLSLSLTRQEILDMKSEYLTDGRLRLLCQCSFPTKLQWDRVEETQQELPWAALHQSIDLGHNKYIRKAKENLFGYPSALDDMKNLYINQSLTDVEQKTKTKSFPAHKNVLSARSAVFEAMMTHDMKEKNTACIRVDDLEDDTVEQLLLFLYSDSIENLQWKSAAQLYYAADKYQIGKLKAACSLFLVENLNFSNAGELLLLAHTHNDSNIQKIAEDFILENEEQVFVSEEWEKLMKANPLLALETMHLKYKRKK